jgi:hypothetical protein
VPAVPCHWQEARERKRAGAGGVGGAETLSQQVINNSAAVQQDRVIIRRYMCSGKFILASVCLRRVGIDGRSYAAASTQVSTVVTPIAPAAQISA